MAFFGAGGGGGVATGDENFLPHGDAFHGFQGSLSQSQAYLRPAAAASLGGSGGGGGHYDEYANEPPLLEELGVNFAAIGTKTTAVLMLHRPISPEVLLDADLAGPLVFCVVLGLCLLLVRVSSLRSVLLSLSPTLALLSVRARVSLRCLFGRLVAWPSARTASRLLLPNLSRPPPPFPSLASCTLATFMALACWAAAACTCW
jgi:hypothetical protein